MSDEGHELRTPAAGAGVAAATFVGATDFLPPSWATWAFQRAAAGASTQSIFEALNAQAQRTGMVITWTLPFLERHLQQMVANRGGASWCLPSLEAPPLSQSAASLRTLPVGVAQLSPASPSWASTEIAAGGAAGAAAGGPAAWSIRGAVVHDAAVCPVAHAPASAAGAVRAPLPHQSSQLSPAVLDAAVRASGQLTSSPLRVSFAAPPGSASSMAAASQGRYATRTDSLCTYPPTNPSSHAPTKPHTPVHPTLPLASPCTRTSICTHLSVQHLRVHRASPPVPLCTHRVGEARHEWVHAGVSLCEGLSCASKCQLHLCVHAPLCALGHPHIHVWFLCAPLRASVVSGRGCFRNVELEKQLASLRQIRESRVPVDQTPLTSEELQQIRDDFLLREQKDAHDKGGITVVDLVNARCVATDPQEQERLDQRIAAIYDAQMRAALRTSGWVHVKHLRELLKARESVAVDDQLEKERLDRSITFERKAIAQAALHAPPAQSLFKASGTHTHLAHRFNALSPSQPIQGTPAVEVSHAANMPMPQRIGAFPQNVSQYSTAAFAAADLSSVPPPLPSAHSEHSAVSPSQPIQGTPDVEVSHTSSLPMPQNIGAFPQNVSQYSTAAFAAADFSSVPPLLPSAHPEQSAARLSRVQSVSTTTPDPELKAGRRFSIDSGIVHEAGSFGAAMSPGSGLGPHLPHAGQHHSIQRSPQSRSSYSSFDSRPNTEARAASRAQALAREAAATEAREAEAREATAREAAAREAAAAFFGQGSSTGEAETADESGQLCATGSGMQAFDLSTLSQPFFGYTFPGPTLGRVPVSDVLALPVIMSPTEFLRLCSHGTDCSTGLSASGFVLNSDEALQFATRGVEPLRLWIDVGGTAQVPELQVAKFGERDCHKALWLIDRKAPTVLVYLHGFPSSRSTCQVLLPPRVDSFRVLPQSGARNSMSMLFIRGEWSCLSDEARAACHVGTVYCTELAKQLLFRGECGASSALAKGGNGRKSKAEITAVRHAEEVSRDLTKMSDVPADVPRGPFKDHATLEVAVKSYAADVTLGGGSWVTTRQTGAQPASKRAGSKLIYQCHEKSCGWRLTYEYSLEGWSLYSWKDHTDHEHLGSVQNEVFVHAAARYIPQEFVVIGEAMASANSSVAEINRVLTKKAADSKVEVSWNADLLRSQFLPRGADSTFDASGFVELLEEKHGRDGLRYYYQVDGEARLKNIFVEVMDGFDEWAHGGKDNVLLFDPTFGTNRVGLKLAPFTTISSCGQTVIIAYLLHRFEDEDTFYWAFKCFASVFRSAPSSFWTDSDLAIAGACAKAVLVFWQGCVHCLCIFHLSKNFYKHIRPCYVGKDEEWKQIHSKFWRIAKDSNSSFCDLFDDEFEELRTMFTNDSSGDTNAAAWLEILYAKRRQWALCWVWCRFTGGIHSTQRAEGMQKDLKLLINGTTSLCALDGSLTLSNENKRKRRDIRDICQGFTYSTLVFNMCPPCIRFLYDKLTFFAFQLVVKQYQESMNYSAVLIEGTTDSWTVTRQKYIQHGALAYDADGLPTSYVSNEDFGLDAASTSRVVEYNEIEGFKCYCQYSVAFGGLPCSHELCVALMRPHEVDLLDGVSSKWLARSPTERSKQQSNLRAKKLPDAPITGESSSAASKQDRTAQLVSAARMVAEVASLSDACMHLTLKCFTEMHSRLLVGKNLQFVDSAAAPEVTETPRRVAGRNSLRSLLGSDFTTCPCPDTSLLDKRASTGSQLVGKRIAVFWDRHEHIILRKWCAGTLVKHLVESLPVVDTPSGSLEPNFEVQYEGEDGPVHHALHQDDYWNTLSSQRVEHHNWVLFEEKPLSSSVDPSQVLPPQHNVAKGRKRTNRFTPASGPGSRPSRKKQRSSK